MISSYFKKIRSIPVKVVPGDVVESQVKSSKHIT